jgi:hypothetical protein
LPARHLNRSEKMGMSFCRSIAGGGGRAPGDLVLANRMKTKDKGGRPAHAPERRVAVPDADEIDGGSGWRRYVRSSTLFANTQSRNLPHFGARSRGVGFPIGFSGRLDCVCGGLAQVLNPIAKPPAVLGRLKAVERILE